MKNRNEAQQNADLNDELAAEVVNLNPIPTFVVDANHVVTHWNVACERLTGVPANEIIGTRNQWRAFYATERPVLADIILDGAEEADVQRFYGGKYRKSDLIDSAYEAEDFFPKFGPGGRWLYFTAAPLHNAAGVVIGAVETLQDVTLRRSAEAALKLERARMASVLNGSSVATFVIDLQHRVSFWNRACEVLTGHPAEEMIGTSEPWRAFYPAHRPVMADLVLDGALAADMERYYHGRFRPSLHIPEAVEAEDYFPLMGDGGRWLYFTAAPLRDDQGQVIGAIETLQDFTERKNAEIALQKSEERYRQLSLTDGLTQLGNSRSCYADLERELARSQRYSIPLTLLLLDADHFKHYNDTWGHLEGDHALIALADTIRHNLRKTDSAYRYGGEEFVVLLPQTALDQALILAERIRSDYAATGLRPAEGQTTHLTVSIGAAELRPGDTARSLLARADGGTYRAKAQGRNCVVAVR
ncbi:MAG TPA: diguanylate cyclase [Rhodocyclaceae bacterium]